MRLMAKWLVGDGVRVLDRAHFNANARVGLDAFDGRRLRHASETPLVSYSRRKTVSFVPNCCVATLTAWRGSAGTLRFLCTATPPPVRPELCMNILSIIVRNHKREPETGFQGRGRSHRTGPFSGGSQQPATPCEQRFPTPGSFWLRSHFLVVATHKAFITSDVCGRSLRLARQVRATLGLQLARMAGSVAHIVSPTIRAGQTTSRWQMIDVSTSEGPGS